MRKVLILLFVSALSAAPSWSGIHYKSKTYVDDGHSKDAGSMEVEGWVDGESAKILFTSSGNPMMGSGSYLLTTNGGSTLFLVNPREKTYAEWDLDKMLGMAGSVMEGMGGAFEMNFSNPKVETLLNEPGGKIVSLSTMHTRYRSSYTMEMKIMGMKRANTVESVQDIWSTEEIGDAAFGVWQRKGSLKTGNQALDDLIASEMDKVKGWPLKMITESTTTGRKGKQTVTRSVMEVVALDRVDVSSSMFEIPADFQKTEMMLPGMMMESTSEDDDEQEEQSGGRFKRFKKLMGKDNG